MKVSDFKMQQQYPSLCSSFTAPQTDYSPITMTSNLVDVKSPEHFKELLSADLNRVALLNFWAPWAEPCAEFNKAVEGEAAKFPSVLFLNVS